MQRASKCNEPSHRLLYVPTAGSSAGAIRLIIEDHRLAVWLEIFIVCLNGQGKDVAEPFRRFLADIKPHLVILGGIAGGASNHDLSVGDIAVSDIVHSPIYKKSRPSGEQVVLDQKRGSLTLRLAEFSLFDALSQRLTKYVRENHTRPSKKEIAEAVENQKSTGHDLSLAKERANKRIERLFSLSIHNAVSVAAVEAYSEPVNQQALYTAFAKTCELNPALGIAEMEAQVLHDVMLESGRRDQPLIVKCISDVPGFLRSDRIKNLCRSLAAEALFGFFEQSDFALALGQAEGQYEEDSIARRSFTRSPDTNRPLGIANEESLIQLTVHPEAFTEAHISLLSELISNDNRLAAAMIDILVHFAEVCPRCGRGAVELLRLRPVFEATLGCIAQGQNEILRAGRLAGVAPLYGVDNTAVDKLDWSSLANGLRGSSQRESKKSALMGRVYDLMSRDFRETVLFVQQLRRTGEFHDQSLAIWFHTAVAAAVSRGENIQEIEERFSADWERYISLYDTRNPFSSDITALVPVMTGKARVDEVSGASEKLDRLAFEMKRDPDKSPMGMGLRVLATTALVSSGHQDSFWDEETMHYAQSMMALHYMPLAPISSIRYHIGNLSNSLSQPTKSA